jgi:hypothetical protein
MRLTHILCAVAVGAGTVAVSGPTLSVHAAAPPGCRNNSSGTTEFCDHTLPAGGPLGSIALLGDSVLLGSSPGMSTPSLPDMLQASGWGPIRMSTTLGMATYSSLSSKRDSSGYHWIDRWKAAGVNPSVIAVNLGANHLGTCTVGNPAACKTAILRLLDEITAEYPNARVWWAKIVHKLYPSGQYSSGMLGWNLALDQVAAERPNLVLWDWPTALATANPPITMDLASVHPISPPQYVKRSTLINEHVSRQMGAARYDGPRETLPSTLYPGLQYQPVAGGVAFHSATSGAITGGSTLTIDSDDLPGIPANARAAVVTIGAWGAPTPGYLTVHPCDQPRPTSSSLNYRAAAQRFGQTIGALSATRTMCVFTSATAHVAVFVHGYFVDGTAQLFTPVAPVRVANTKQSGRQALVQVPVPAGAEAVAVNVTVGGPSNGGGVQVYPCNDPTVYPAIFAFGANETTGVQMIVETSDASTICVQVNADALLTDVYVDLTGTFSPGGALEYNVATPKRLLDTRSKVGGWTGRHGFAQVIDVLAAPPGAQAATGSLVITTPSFNGHIRAFPCGIPLPLTAAVNGPAGQVVLNMATISLSADQRLCLFASTSTHTIFDVAGWWTA